MCNSGGIFQLIPHTWAALGLGPTLTSASPLTVFTAEPLMHSQIINRENLYLFQRENAFLAGAGHRKHPLEKVWFPCCSHSDNWRAGEPRGVAEWGVTPTTGSSESQPLPPGTALGTQPNQDFSSKHFRQV